MQIVGFCYKTYNFRCQFYGVDNFYNFSFYFVVQAYVCLSFRSNVCKGNSIFVGNWYRLIRGFNHPYQ